MKLFIIVSHYLKLAQTIKEYLLKMLPIKKENVKIEAISGINEELGTDPFKILEVIQSNPDISEIFIFPDLGSAVLSAESMIPMIEDKKVFISKGAIVENTFAAYVLANAGADFESVCQASLAPLQK
ncbi:PTS-dependent dihydroxyacetone kinase phosphotransferase subunit DhaM [Mycoplasma sp. 6243]|uniref:PTS-dependent dihydroxyacetone kinase phosphotransferase subunit DhaM n=1 Tax=Mycoplasma sp. 6243 TaxID=3440865 RepID=UPI003EBDF00F